MPDLSVSITRCAQPGVPSPGYPAAGAPATVARTFAVRATVPPRHPSRRRPSPGAASSWPGGRRPVPARGSGPRARPPEKIAAALGWAERASLPVAELEDTATVRLVLGACARTLTGKAAAGSTQRRKRSVFYNALGYAVAQGHLASSPVDRIQWTIPAVEASVDRRVVVAPPRPGTCWPPSGHCPSGGQHLEAFFRCLYYAALRPSEAVMLREADLYLYLPKQGWGRIVLAASMSRAGTALTDDGTARQ